MISQKSFSAGLAELEAVKVGAAGNLPKAAEKETEIKHNAHNAGKARRIAEE